MAPQVIRPDNVLKRAEELIAVGKEDSALQILHEFLISKRTRSVAPAALEPIAILYVQLSVDLRKGFTLRDGLHQFKKNVQIAETGLPVVETVARKLIDAAEKRLVLAQSKADLNTEADDLEVRQSPEDILLSAVSSDQSKDRTDREVVTPWLHFLWESFRLVLDLLRNNARLEVTYFDIVQQAYQFCLKYNRKSEFKRLSDLLRVHIQSATTQQKFGNKQVNAVDLQDPNTLSRYLELRFNQLNVSVKLELWQEAFRSVEDIHSLITISKRPLKPTLMVSYYENLAKIFSVSDNALFHAAAWNRFYNLYSQSPNATEEQLSRYSSIFLLSSLSIPKESYNLDFSEDFAKHSEQRLASLLNLPKAPTREYLVQFALNKNVYDYVDPVVQELYQLLEADFNPLTIATKFNELTSKLESNPFFSPYIKPLIKVILPRLFEQVSQVYESVKLDFLIQLATFKGKFGLSPLEVESSLLNAGRDGQLSFFIDHDAGVITFQNDPFHETASSGINPLQQSPADLVRSQLSNLAKTLYASTEYIDPSYAEKQKALRERLIASATKALVKEREEIEKSRELLEERKHQAELKQKEREVELAKAKQQRLEEEKAAEAKRVEEEAKRRLQEKIQREQNHIKELEKKKIIEDINARGIIKLDADKLDDVEPEKIRSMQLEQLEKDKNDLENRTKALFKKLDHTERAYRKYELPLLEKDATLQKDKDLKLYEEIKEKRIAAAKKEHAEAIELRNRLQRIVPEFEQFTHKLGSEAAAKRATLVKANNAKLEAAKKERLEKVRQQLYEERLAEYEAELKAQEEEEAREIAEAARKAEEEKRLEDLRKLREEREAENRKLDEKAAKQREVEALIEQKTQAAYKPPIRNFPTPAPSSSSPSPSSSPAPSSAAPKKLTYAEKLRLKREGKLP